MTDYQHDIKRYLSGEMTPAEMNALEKKALSDPFLADALEGAQLLPPASFADDLNRLQSDLNARIRKKFHGRTLVWRIAAGLLLLAVSAYIIVWISGGMGDKGSGNLALTKPQEEVSPLSPPAPLSSADSTSEPASRDESKDVRTERAEKPQGSPKADQPVQLIPEAKREGEPDLEKQQAEQATPEAGLSSDERTTEGLLEKEIELVAPEETGPIEVKEEAQRKKSRVSDDDKTRDAASKSLAAAPSGRAAADSDNVKRKIIQGKVSFAEDGTGLPGVNVLVRGSNEGTVTDTQGFYQIAVEETEPILLFSFIGFTNKEVVATSDRLDVQLEADVSELSEVVVVGYGADGSVKSPATTITELAAPEGGRKAFKQYLEKNLRYPQEALKNEVEGKVTIQFSIGMTGQLSDFRVIKGIGHGCDEEVIRLIKAGPKWYPSKKNEEPIKDRVRVRMRFALPKK
ncbi:MAG TPA: TonB family protein [Chryseolinea sp.]